MQKEVLDYITGFHESCSVIFWNVRQIILDAHPGIEEKFSYQTPFYYFNGPLIYLTWSKLKKLPVLGFVNGAEMTDDFGILQADEGQKQIRHIILNPGPSGDIIRQYVNQALEIRFKNLKLNN